MELVLKSRRPLKLFSSVDTAAFASIAIVLLLTLLLVVWTPPTHHAYSVDLAQVGHPVRMPGASRDDALRVTITRDSQAFFGVDRIRPVDFPGKIRDRLKDLGVERKVYITADMRARWGTVKMVLDGVRSAGIIRVAFLVDQGRVPILTQ